MTEKEKQVLATFEVYLEGDSMKTDGKFKANTPPEVSMLLSWALLSTGKQVEELVKREYPELYEDVKERSRAHFSENITQNDKAH